MPCKSCNEFYQTVKITSSEQLDKLIERFALDLLKQNIFSVVDGSLQWDDVIDCILECQSCRQRYRLTCDTYHGRGGEIGPVADDNANTSGEYAEKLIGYFGRLCDKDARYCGISLQWAEQWLDLINSDAPTQQEVDELIKTLDEKKPSGSGWIELQIRVKGWARDKGFTVPE